MRQQRNPRRSSFLAPGSITTTPRSNNKPSILDQVSFTVVDQKHTGPSHGHSRAQIRAKNKAPGGSDDEEEEDVPQKSTQKKMLTFDERRRLAQQLSGRKFDKLQRQFQDRQRAHHEKVQQEVADIDVNVFFEDPKPSAAGSNCVFQLNGALPPTTAARSLDMERAKAIGVSEKEAAQQLIGMRREADQARVGELVEATKAGKQPTWLGRAYDKQRQTPSMSARAAMALGSGCNTPPSPSSRAVSRLSIPEAAANGLLQERHCVDERPAYANQPMSAREWKAFESRISDFHRQAEYREVEERARVGRAESRNAEVEQGAYVQNSHFDHQHVKAEAGIINASKHRQAVQSYRQYKDGIQEKLFGQWKNDHSAMQARQQVVSTARKEKATRKAYKESQIKFSARTSLVSNACQKVDIDDLKDQRRRLATVKVAVKKARWAVQSSQARSRHNLHQAEQKHQEALKRHHVRFLLHKARERLDNEVATRKEMIVAERRFKAYMQELAAELIERSQFEHASNELEAYERTLAVLRELSVGVREHSLRVRELVTMRAQVSVDGEGEGEGDLDAEWSDFELPAVLNDESLAKAFLPVEAQVRSALSTALSTTLPTSDRAPSSEWPASPRTATAGSAGFNLTGGFTTGGFTAALETDAGWDDALDDQQQEFASASNVRPETAPAPATRIVETVAEMQTTRLPFFNHAPRPPPKALPRQPAPRGLSSSVKPVLMKAIKLAGPSNIRPSTSRPDGTRPFAAAADSHQQHLSAPDFIALLTAQQLGPQILEENLPEASYRSGSSRTDVRLSR